MGGWIVRIGIVAVIAIGIFVFRDRLSSSAGDLAVGDCFDEPSIAIEIKDVQHHPCNEAHTAEVIFVGDMTGSNDIYPSDAELDRLLRRHLRSRLQDVYGQGSRGGRRVDVRAVLPDRGGLEGRGPRNDLLRGPLRHRTDHPVDQGGALRTSA